MHLLNSRGKFYLLRFFYVFIFFFYLFNETLTTKSLLSTRPPRGATSAVWMRKKKKKTRGFWLAKGRAFSDVTTGRMTVYLGLLWGEFIKLLPPSANMFSSSFRVKLGCFVWFVDTSGWDSSVISCPWLVSAGGVVLCSGQSFVTMSCVFSKSRKSPSCTTVFVSNCHICSRFRVINRKENKHDTGGRDYLSLWAQ